MRSVGWRLRGLVEEHGSGSRGPGWESRCKLLFLVCLLSWNTDCICEMIV